MKGRNDTQEPLIKNSGSPASIADLIENVKAEGAAQIDVTDGEALIKLLEERIAEYDQSLNAEIDPEKRELLSLLKQDTIENLSRMRVLTDGEEEMSSIQNRIEALKTKGRKENYLLGLVVFISGIYLVYLYAQL